ncbi:hypothetical protein ABZ442_05025 [Streptomyces triculaminicus]|uniref:hypothetical protein n=1 Tax=Streptomyces triculaminicus TaxID=2816232 RepID=UPI0034093886
MTGDGAPLCLCGHRWDKHNSPAATGGVQCRDCPIDDEGRWRHLYTPDDRPETTETSCYAAHCQAAATLEQIRTLTVQLAELGAGCLWQCGAAEIAERIQDALTPSTDRED